MAVAAVRIVSLPQRELRKARLAKRAVDCALVIGFGAAYGAGSLIRPGWLQFFFKPEDAVQLLDWFTLFVDPAGRMPFYFTTFRR